MVFDPQRGRAVLFGGYTNTWINETWEWDGSDWLQRTPATSPSARVYLENAFAFDGVRGVPILFGGLVGSTVFGDTWKFDGANWVPVLNYAVSPVNGHRYALTPPMTWQQAEAIAVQEGGHLATIRSASDNTWISLTLEPSQFKWIGMSDASVEGAWIWSSGEAVGYTNWSGGQPDDALGQDYGVIEPGGTWDDRCPFDCAAFAGVVERPGIPGGSTASLTPVALSTTTPPAALTALTLAPLPTSGALLFGGTTSTLPQPFTYILDNTTWSKQFSLLNPMPRTDASLLLDPARSNNILFGGRNPLGAALADTWIWQNSQWNYLPLAITPSPRSGHRMAFDRVANVGLLFGGKNAAGNATNDFWQWNGTAWSQLTPATLPPARSLHGFAYDELRQRAVVYGGIDGTTRLDDIWEWNGTTWTQITPATTGGFAWTPGARSGHTMAYDPRSERVVIHGGETSNGCQQDVWSWDGTQWTLHTATTAVPSARTGAALWHDPAVNQLRLFGGGCGTTYTNDLWQLTLPVYSRSSNYGQACVGSLGTPTIGVTAPSAPILGTTVNVRLTNIFGTFVPAFAALGFQRATFGGIPLPLDLTVLGLPGCFLQNSADQFLTLTAPSGGIVNWQLPLPNSPQLLGAELFLQGLGLEVPGYPRWGSMTDGLLLRLGDR